MSKEKKKPDPQEVLDEWLERDLSEAARQGQLAPAFERDDEMMEIAEIMRSGRHPILIGESGVGKSAIIHELVRRAHAGQGPEFLMGKRFCQFSLRHAASFNPRRIGLYVQRLVEALLHFGDSLIPVFREFDLADRFYVEHQFLALGYRFPGVILAEGSRSAIQSMFEYNAELEQLYCPLVVDEPSFEKTKRLLEHWSRRQQETRSRTFTPEALDHALHLSHRFVARARQPRKVLDLLAQLDSTIPIDRTVTAENVFDRFCASHKTPRALVDPGTPFDLDHLECRFNDKILGQREAVRTMVDMIGRIKAGLADVRRPFGAFLFAGPTGVGKTHVAQLLADYLFGSRERMIRLNMADYSSDAAADVLFGSPDADDFPKKRGVLTHRVTGHPFATVLLDEFEKASPKVHDRFLQLMDEGCFINAVGEIISCRSMIIIATTNAGAELYRGQTFGFANRQDRKSLDEAVDRRLEEKFRFEFLNRFDAVVHFHPLSRQTIRTIASRELAQLRDRSGLTQRQLHLEVDDSVLDWLAVHGYDEDYGARFLRRVIERSVTSALANVVVRDCPPPGSTIELLVRGNQIVARRRVEPEPETARRETVTLPHGMAEQARTLDETGLRREAEGLLADVQSRLAILEDNKSERSELLERMNEPAFWNQSPDKESTIDRFRTLDVAIRVEERLAKTMRRFTIAVQEFTAGTADLAHVARAVESAARAISEWDDRHAAEGPASVWVVISATDPFKPASDWIEQLARMEMGWCRITQLAARATAFEQTDGQLTRIVLGAEGPGALGYLEMERGVHRLSRHPQTDARARIEVIPCGDAPQTPWPAARATRRTPGPLGIMADCKARLELPARGLIVDLWGPADASFWHLLHTLQEWWQESPSDPADTVRIYGTSGQGATDERTGTTAPRIKDVLKGNLNPFLQAWRRRQSEPQL